jgi:hypothetical protein
MKFLSKKWIPIVVATFAILSSMAGFGLYLMYPAFKVPSPPEFATPNNRAEANKQDLAYLRETLHEMDRSFSSAEWATFDMEIDDLSRRADKLDAAALEMGIAKAVAVANNGHTNLLGAGRGLTLNSIPLRFYRFADGLRVVKADPANWDLLGARVLQVAGRAPDELAQIFAAYVGGSAALSRELSVYFMESPLALHAIGLQDSASTSELTLETVDGDVIVRNAVAVPVPASGPAPEKTPQTLRFDRRELYWPRRDLSPIPLPTEAPFPQPINDGRQWGHVLDKRNVPFTLKNPNSFYWATYLAGGKVLFLQINAIMDEPGGEPLKTFLETALKDVAAKKPRFVILDLRSNPGGSYPQAADFTQKLPTLMPKDGKIFILTSGNTFSAAIITAARLKYFSGIRGEIVGEPMGDHPQFWAEAATRIGLPNSGLRVAYATGYHDWEHGCSIVQILICYPANFSLGVAAGDLQPTLPVSWSFADYVEGKDTAIEKIMQIAAVAE